MISDVRHAANRRVPDAAAAVLPRHSPDASAQPVAYPASPERTQRAPGQPDPATTPDHAATTETTTFAARITSRALPVPLHDANGGPCLLSARSGGAGSREGSARVPCLPAPSLLPPAFRGGRRTWGRPRPATVGVRGARLGCPRAGGRVRLVNMRAANRRLPRYTCAS